MDPFGRYTKLYTEIANIITSYYECLLSPLAFELESSVKIVLISFQENCQRVLTNDPEWYGISQQQCESSET